MPLNGPKQNILEKIISRFFAFFSGTLVTTAGTCIGNLSWLLGNGIDDPGKAVQYNTYMLLGFVALGAFFFHKKKALDAAANDETKDGLDLTPSELLMLTLNEGIQNLTAAMAAIMAQVNYQLMPASQGFGNIFSVFFWGCVVLVVGEGIQRTLKKGSMCEYIVNLLNGLNVGSVSWWLGLALSNFTQERLGASHGSGPSVYYWMFFVSLIFGVVLVEIFTWLQSTKLGKSKDGKPYADVLFSMLKGTPLYSAGWVLDNVVEYRWTDHYIGGTFLWMIISPVVLVPLQHVVHLEKSKLAPGHWHATKEDMWGFANQMVALMGQILAFVTGNLAGNALAQIFPDASDFAWILLGVICQALGFLVEGARTRWLPTLFKDAGEAETDIDADAEGLYKKLSSNLR